jgi:hypothetical protein
VSILTDTASGVDYYLNLAVKDRIFELVSTTIAFWKGSILIIVWAYCKIAA